MLVVATVEKWAGPVKLRLATSDGDIAFLSALARDPSVEPFLAPGRGDPAALRELNGAEPPSGLYLIESEGHNVGGFSVGWVNRRSQICDISRVMVDPDARGAGFARSAVRLASRNALIDHGLHRIQTEVYGDNLPGQRLFERAGFTREGTRRRAYRRRDRWLDGILYGLLADEL